MTTLNGNVEFALHLLKRRASGGKGDRYTIGRWEGTVLRAICHDAGLDCALAAVRREMETAGEELVVGNPHDSRNGAGR